MYRSPLDNCKQHLTSRIHETTFGAYENCFRPPYKLGRSLLLCKTAPTRNKNATVLQGAPLATSTLCQGSCHIQSVTVLLFPTIYSCSPLDHALQLYRLRKLRFHLPYTFRPSFDMSLPLPRRTTEELSAHASKLSGHFYCPAC